MHVTSLPRYLFLLSKDPWKAVDGEYPPDAPIKSEKKTGPQITPNFFSHIPDPKKADEDDCQLDDIDPIMPELIDPIDYQGPGYSPVVVEHVEPSAPEILEGNLDDDLEIAPSAPPPAYEDTVTIVFNAFLASGNKSNTLSVKAFRPTFTF